MISKMMSKIILLLFCVTQVFAQETLTIPLNKLMTYENRELYADFMNLNGSSSLQVNFENFKNNNLSFIIFQVHSHLYDVTVYKNVLVRGSYISGTNVGFYSAIEPGLDTFIVINNNVGISLKLFITVHGYWKTDPIPGGCNMEFPVPISPYLITNYTKDYVYIDAAPSKDNHDPNCLNLNETYEEFYMMYLPEKDLSSDTYFKGIRSMLTYTNILDNGNIIPWTYWNMRRVVAAYPGTGTVYVAIAENPITKAYSVYVPATTYACSALADKCDMIEDTFSQVLCASLLFIGVFLCYFGHRFFNKEMFFVGFFTGLILTYILISFITILEQPALITASVVSGLFFGAIWLLFWWLYGIPVFSVLLNSLNLGFMTAAIIYHGLPADTEPYLRMDFNFWFLFVLIMLLVALLLVSITFYANLIWCSVIGAYATIYPIDYYLGSSLKFILINTLRRAMVPKFHRVVLMPPFQYKDILLTVLWAFLAISGFVFQYYYNKGRPPFPPPPRSVGPRMPEPRTYGVAEPRPRRWRLGDLFRTSTTEPLDERTPLLT